MSNSDRDELYARLCLEKYKMRLMKGVDRLAERARGDSKAFFKGISELMAQELGCSLAWIGDGFGAPLFVASRGPDEEPPRGWTEKRVQLHYYDEAQTVKCALYLYHRTEAVPEITATDDLAGQGRARLKAAMVADEPLFREAMAEVLDTAGFDNFIAQTSTRQSELSSCVGGELADLIMRHGISSNALRPSRKFMGYLFADVCGYTAFAASNPSEVVMDTINHFLAGAVRIVNEHPNSLLDKYVGDCLVVLVGALDQEDAEAAHAEGHDLLYAEEGLALVRRLMEFSRRQGFELSAGFHVGEGHAGFVGVEDPEGLSGDRLDFTAIGRNMNYAARLQDCARSGTLLVSREVRDLLRTNPTYGFKRLTRKFKNIGRETVYAVDWPDGSKKA